MMIQHPLATAWLARVDDLAADLPAGVRGELLADLREHLDTALPPDADQAEVAAVLERLGDPADVVAAARADAGGSPPPPPPPAAPAGPGPGLTTAEAVALVALVLAGLVVPLFWPLSVLLFAVGAAVVASVGRWRGGEAVAALLLPVPWALVVASVLLPVGMSTTTCTSDASGVEQCVTEGGGAQPLLLVAAVALLVVTVLLTRWLARAPRGRPARR